MQYKTLESARTYEKEAGEKIDNRLRPRFHMTPYAGWANDPNGFSWYKGAYHLFYQYNPYSQYWDSMHWGHVVTKDLLHWEYLPCALAPDQAYDSFGCFSGSAIELKDGRQLIIYTGVSNDIQSQCIAIGDGVNYEKLENNPVIDAASIPEGFSSRDFRDPKIWQEEDGSFRCVIGARKPEKEGSILLFSSPDGCTWTFESVLIANDGRFGSMWECPDFFELDGKNVLLCSPQDMQAKDLEYPNGHGTLCLIGSLDGQRKHFTPEHDQTVDNGIDFYAPQTLLAPDGRRIMIGWMQNWASCDQSLFALQGWFGQMTLPRELHIRNGHLYQTPVRELEQYRTGEVSYTGVLVSEKTTLPGVSGRVLDMTVTLHAAGDQVYNAGIISVAEKNGLHTDIRFMPYSGELTVDRTETGSRKAFVHQRSCLVPGEAARKGEITLRLIMDLYSLELFVNEGEKAMSTVLFHDSTADGISFAAYGTAVMDITAYQLSAD